MANIAQALRSSFNVNNYDSLQIGETVETVYGDFVCTGKPNIYQRIDDRTWTFEQATDADGEPYTDGPKITIK